MKQLPFFLFFASIIIGLITGCSGLSNKTKPFEWLAGKWVDEGNGFYESWTKSGDTMMIGYGYQLIEGDTIFGESLKIKKHGENWAYIVNTENVETIFYLVNKPGDSIVFDNPENSFPKRITYVKKSNGNISATIENPGNSENYTRFDFRPIK
ncbi:MAG: hypothetical protein HGA37_08105 [Lentimicrobium sp.]|nr:hypothetical protein [Lentimicrobium sp.]